MMLYRPRFFAGYIPPSRYERWIMVWHFIGLAHLKACGGHVLSSTHDELIITMPKKVAP